jgi:hypothetical protein
MHAAKATYSISSSAAAVPTLEVRVSEVTIRNSTKSDGTLKSSVSLGARAPFGFIVMSMRSK